MKYISVTYKIGILVSLLFWVGCKEDNKTYAPIQLNFSRVDVKVGVTALLQVSGSENFTTELSNDRIVALSVSNGVVHITGIKVGSTTLTVTGEGGDQQTCTITVVENAQLETDFIKDETSRIEGWRDVSIKMDAQEGGVFSMQKDVNALGVSALGSVTYDYSWVDDEDSFFRASALGTFTSSGILDDGLVVYKESGQDIQYLISEKVEIKQIKNGKVWLVFQFPGRRDIRIVTDAF
ncbi:MULTISPECIES: hypothetical protein [Bacteroidales]|jgi:lipoprotein|uniref:hypothetical protein n=1 Tax=Bacteroidales TaxID=171549 RepID=UPI0005740D16|nr:MULTISPECIES: hypothetical protein [Bacteroidales]KHM47811.1 hypothetical protein PU94_06740 [Coprobacter secundus]